MATIAIIALILVIIGALNWLLVALFNFNLVAAIFGERSAASKVIYVLVGIAGLYTIYLLTLIPGAMAQSRPG
ncbi:MAG: DUF378 domain-containing protein [Armatimonadota bacterium]|nr:DUF378 domain-containing protein [Armatimonadota bacterium]